MLSSGINNFLFRPGFNNGMAALDDQTSMFSVAARDAVGSSGRIGMEYQRDKHGGRERLLEEVLTLIIWGFGVRAIKEIYDATMLGPLNKRLKIDLPDLDTGMLPSKFGDKPKPGEQTLHKKLLEDFKTRFPEVKQYGELKSILNNPALKRSYQISSMAKFGVASLVPAAAIAFLVPTFNQWLTRQLVSKEDQAKQLAARAARQTRHAVNPWVQSVGKSPWAAPHASGIYNAFNTPVKKAQGGASATSNAAPPQSFGAHQMAPFAAAAHPGGQVKFGGMGMLANAASTILQNEQYNTLLIDGVISGGRTYKARNPVERAEIIFREVTLILFLYIAQAQIQKGINKGIGKLMHIPASLGFRSMHYINEQLKVKDSNFLKKFGEDSEAIEQKINTYLQTKLEAELKGSNKLLNLQSLAENPKLRTEALLNTIHKYFLEEREDLAKRNHVFESAIDSGLIPTFKENAAKLTTWQQVKAIGKELNPAAEKDLLNNTHLDLSKKIDTSGVLDLKAGMRELTKTVEEKGVQELPKMLNWAMKLRFVSLVASNVACFAALSVIFPEIQHWMTYKLTGKNYFPGIQTPNPTTPVKS